MEIFVLASLSLTPLHKRFQHFWNRNLRRQNFAKHFFFCACSMQRFHAGFVANKVPLFQFPPAKNTRKAAPELGSKNMPIPILIFWVIHQLYGDSATFDFSPFLILALGVRWWFTRLWLFDQRLRHRKKTGKKWRRNHLARLWNMGGGNSRARGIRTKRAHGIKKHFWD